MGKLIKQLFDLIISIFKKDNQDKSNEIKRVGIPIKPGDAVSWDKNGRIYKPYNGPNYFQPHETKCKCTDKTCTKDIRDDLRLLLNIIRDEFGEPLIINSGYRCPDYNELKGGAKDSQHPKGQAADIHIKNLWMQQRIFDLAVQHGATAVGLYNTFIHIDIRLLATNQSGRRWDNRDDKSEEIFGFWSREVNPNPQINYKES